MHDLHGSNENGFVADGIAHAAHIRLCHIAECLARERHIDRPRHALKVRECCTVRNLDDAVLHEARVRHQDGDDAPFAERQKL